VFTLLGDIFAIEAGIGAVALTGAVPLMQILDRLVKSRIKWV
jgi:hypothetical protein